MSQEYNEIRLLCRTFYQTQELRVEIGNRIAAAYRSKLGESPNKKIKDSKAKGALAGLIEEYANIINLFGPQTTVEFYFKEISPARRGMITTPFEFNMLARYNEIINTEKRLSSYLKQSVKKSPIWKQCLSEIIGCGPLMSAVCISELDPYKAPHASSFVKYAGLDVVDGRGRGRFGEHHRKVRYVAHNGAPSTKSSLTYNPFLKAKLIGVLSTSFIRYGKGEFNELYYAIKSKYSERKELSKGHIEAMARRYIIKAFLYKLWAKWREIEGLTVSAPYTCVPGREV